MRVNIFLLALSCFLYIHDTLADTSFMVDHHTAVFIPSGYESKNHSSSVIFSKELINQGSLVSSWSIEPIFSKEDGKTIATIFFGKNIDLYGNGEVIGPLKRNNTHVTLWNTDNYCYQKDSGKRLYQSHPWIMGVREDGTCFGIIADNTWKQDFQISEDYLSIRSEGPSFRVIILEKESPQELMKSLGYWTGTMAMPPLWALGYHQCRYSYFPDTKVKEIADEFRSRKIPCDVIWMDIDYMDGYRVFTFDDQTFPNPEKLNRYLHDHNFKSVYMIDPGVKKEEGYFVYDSGSAGDHWIIDSLRNEYSGDVWPGACVFPDFTRLETCSWWGELYQDFMAYGIDGVWNDMNEPAVFDGPDGTMPEDNLHRGSSIFPEDIHLRYHNIYGLLMVKASRDGIMKANPNKRPFVLSRANFLGGQKYAATWTGDNKSTWEHMKLSIPMSLSLGLSGQPFNGPDIGGFEGNCTPELLGHWMALGAYYPFSRNHASKNSIHQEPWVFGEKIESVSRTAINRRYKLLPYMYTLFRDSVETGIPVMQPVFFADSKNLDLRSEEQAFLLGEDLLVVPRWASNLELPEGDWDPIPFEEEDDGYQPIVLIRPGAIVPIGPIVQHTDDYNTDKITLLINPTQNGFAYGELYHDQGDGYGYKNGKYALHKFESKRDFSGKIKIEISKLDGELDYERLYRIGYVKDGEIFYSDWSNSNVHYIDLLDEELIEIDHSLFPSMYIIAHPSDEKKSILGMNYLDNGQWVSDPIFFDKGVRDIIFSTSKNRFIKAWGNSSGLNGIANIFNQKNNKKIRFKISSSDEYIISFDSINRKYDIQLAPEYDYISIVGDATLIGWNPAGIPLEQDPMKPNIFYWNGHLKVGDFKFHTCSGGWNEGYWIHPPKQDQPIGKSSFILKKDKNSDDNKWKITKDGNYSISINLLNNEILIENIISN